MARFRLLLVAFTVWMVIFFNLERPDLGLQGENGNIDLASIVYVIAAAAAVSILVFPDLGKHPEFMFISTLVLYGVGRSWLSPGGSEPSVYLIITEVAVLFITIVIARAVSLAMANFEKAIENVLLNPRNSRILAMTQGEEEINNELFRARRYERPVGFILIRVTSAPGMPETFAERFNLEAAFQRRYLQIRIGQIAEATLYRSDIVAWHNDNLVVCLPETSRDEVQQFARQIHVLVRIRLNMDVPMGIATFPDDGLIYRDLLDAALLNPCNFGNGDGKSLDDTSSTRPLETPDPNVVDAQGAEQKSSRSFISLFSRFSEFLPTSTLPSMQQKTGKARPDDPDLWVNELPYQSASARMIYNVVKRASDLFVVVASFPLTIPLLLLITLAILIDSGQPIFFTQERTGLGGHRFTMYKFRTMVPNAEELLKEMAAQGLAKLDENNKLAEPLKLDEDPRRTRLGRLLRRTSMDELPQIINVLRGHMSLVGPRPTSWGLGSYTLLHTERLSVRPGITGLWQIMARGNTDFDVWLQWDVLYIDKMSFSLDIQIMLRTVGKVFARHGAR